MENILAKKAIQLETLAPQKVLAKLQTAALGPGDPRLPKIMVLTPRKLRLPCSAEPHIALHIRQGLPGRQLSTQQRVTD